MPGIFVDNAYQNSSLPSSYVDLAKVTMNQMKRNDIRRLFATRAYKVLQGLLVVPGGMLPAPGGEFGVERIEIGIGIVRLCTRGQRERQTDDGKGVTAATTHESAPERVPD